MAICMQKLDQIILIPLSISFASFLQLHLSPPLPPRHCRAPPCRLLTNSLVVNLALKSHFLTDLSALAEGCASAAA